MTKAQRRAVMARTWRDYSRTPFWSIPHHARPVQVCTSGVAAAPGVGRRRGRKRRRAVERLAFAQWERGVAEWRRAMKARAKEDIPW